MRKKERLIMAATEIKFLNMLFFKYLHKELNRLLKKSGVNVGGIGFGVMNIVRHNKATISEISKTMMLAPATLVPVVDDLEKKGLLARGKDPNDRRRNPLFLTEKGRQIIGKISTMGKNDGLAKSLRMIKEEEREGFVITFQKLMNAMMGKEEVSKHLEKFNASQNKK